eukprot:CAMPEP_0172324402 /NCGR_PEP_ID=MMETSP1058-20130122/51299_1 /TAXON_ID=83371 /ORGANISM="Detonula confervacea, Strain CCMP 353" /LENGTH=138 /DNA_ID=CAMNT_0013040671 /DNA_START=514 /DNA_END=926 /DNA_ORIENTATION=+
MTPLSSSECLGVKERGRSIETRLAGNSSNDEGLYVGIAACLTITGKPSVSHADCMIEGMADVSNAASCADPLDTDPVDELRISKSVGDILEYTAEEGMAKVSDVVVVTGNAVWLNAELGDKISLGANEGNDAGFFISS